MEGLGDDLSLFFIVWCDMNLKKSILLFLALLFPICIFLFLKFFGKNEFKVPPLYTDHYPEGAKECGVTVALPYHIPDPIRTSLFLSQDSLILIHFGELTPGGEKQLERVSNEFGKAIKLQRMNASDSAMHLKKCVFFLKDRFDLVLVDQAGVIRGQYISDDREEVDRLLTELAILYKKY
jgi:hypothetical protein